MYDRRFTPAKITDLKGNEIFVFGSNLAGAHGGGAARVAKNKFGAIWGQGTGLQGQSYAIPTMQGGVETIRPYTDEFIRFASKHKEQTFLVTRIGCGIAGFKDKDIAPLFMDALDVENIILPKEFVTVLKSGEHSLPSWDSASFISKRQKLHKEAAEGDRNATKKMKELNIQEYHNTMGLVNQGYYITEGGHKVVLPDPTPMERGTIFYSKPFYVDNVPVRNEETKIVVRNIDCLDYGTELLNKGYNPAILNMASRRVPGGGVLGGSRAQEESLFRRTNLFRSLYQFADSTRCTQYIPPARKKEHYPLDRNYGGIYTPNALLFRENEKNGYKLMDSPVRLSFIAVAGINRPEMKDATHLADNMVEGTKNKMRTILRIGLHQGHDSLVLGALGCGAFRNPPSHIAQLFHEVIEEREFKNKYRLICFAILEDHNSNKVHNPNGNYQPFFKEFNAG